MPDGNPYRSIVFERIQSLRWLTEHGDKVAALRVYYRSHIAQFIDDWGFTHDTRNLAKGLPVIIPFRLDPKQREWVEWTYQNWLDGKYGGTEKSRDVGCSWLIAAFSVALAVLYDNLIIGIGSFKQEKVDRKGDLGSLFEKARFFLEALPTEFRGGFQRARDTAENRILFPDTGGSVLGEVGDYIGRGGRYAIYFVDEAAYLEHDQLNDASLAKAAPCRQDVSSVCGMENSFAQRMHDGISRKFTFHWRDNPRFSQADYDAFLRQWGPVITAQELDINYTASVEGIVCLQKWVQAAIDSHIKLAIKVSGARLGALDIADQGRDLNAFASRHGMLLLDAKCWSGKERDVADTAERAYLECENQNLEGFCYDADGGYGSGVRSEANRIDARRAKNHFAKKRVTPFRGSGEVYGGERKVPGTDVLAKDRFQNAKAQGYWWLGYLLYNTYEAVNGREHNPDCLISISSKIAQLSKLCIEISQPKWKISTTGKLMVDKTPDGAASPNLADAVMMLFAPKRVPMVIADDLYDYLPDEEEVDA